MGGPWPLKFLSLGAFCDSNVPPGHLRLIDHPESFICSDMGLPLSSVFRPGSSLLNADRRMDAGRDEPEEAQTLTSGVTRIKKAARDAALVYDFTVSPASHIILERGISKTSSKD